MFKNSHTRTSE